MKRPTTMMATRPPMIGLTMYWRMTGSPRSMFGNDRRGPGAGKARSKTSWADFALLFRYLRKPLARLRSLFEQSRRRTAPPAAPACAWSDGACLRRLELWATAPAARWRARRFHRRPASRRRSRQSTSPRRRPRRGRYGCRCRSGQGRPHIDRRGLHRHQHEAGASDRRAGVGIGVGRAVDQHDLGVARALRDLAAGAPAGDRGEAEPGAGLAQPFFAPLIPMGQARLRVGVDERDDTPLVGPGDPEMRGKGRLAGAALALRNGDDGGGHDRRSSRRESPLSLMLAWMRARFRCCTESDWAATGDTAGFASSSLADARGGASGRLVVEWPAAPAARLSPQRSCPRQFSKPRASAAVSSAESEIRYPERTMLTSPATGSGRTLTISRATLDILLPLIG